MFCEQAECRPGCRGECSTPDTCSCRPGWSGENCTQCEVRAGCQHGTCARPGDCNCSPGWRGTFCSVPDCGPACSTVGGSCSRPGECRCRPGWRGPRCDQCVPQPGCLNGGCVAPWECECELGWAGARCDSLETEQFGPGVRDGRCLPAGSFLCMNSGEDVCSWYGNGSLAELPRCKCQQGFTGRYCEQTLTGEGDGVWRTLPSPVEAGGDTEEDTEDEEEDVEDDAFPIKLGNALEKLK